MWRQRGQEECGRAHQRAVRWPRVLHNSGFPFPTSPFPTRIDFNDRRGKAPLARRGRTPPCIYPLAPFGSSALTAEVQLKWPCIKGALVKGPNYVGKYDMYLFVTLQRLVEEGHLAPSVSQCPVNQGQPRVEKQQVVDMREGEKVREAKPCTRVKEKKG